MNCLLSPAGITLYCCLCEVVFHSHASLNLCVVLQKTEKGLKQWETTKYLVLPAENTEERKKKKKCLPAGKKKKNLIFNFSKKTNEEADVVVRIHLSSASEIRSEQLPRQSEIL